VGARLGILIKGGDAFQVGREGGREGGCVFTRFSSQSSSTSDPPSLPPSYQAACEVTAVVFDKTGTLTTGKAVVTDEVSVCNLLLEAGREGGGEEGQAAAPPTAEEEKQARRRVLALAAAVETGSEHPVAQVSPPSLPPSLPPSRPKSFLLPLPPSLPASLPPSFRPSFDMQRGKGYVSLLLPLLRSPLVWASRLR